jgi:hypothetical protein
MSRATEIEVEVSPYDGSYKLTLVEHGFNGTGRTSLRLDPDDLVRAVQKLAECYFAHEKRRVHDRAQELAADDYFAAREEPK